MFWELPCSQSLSTERRSCTQATTLWKKTGNICIEYKSYGKPSGIDATESDYWFHNLCIGDDEYCTLVFNTATLKKIVKRLDSFKTVSGGDNRASQMYLLNLQKLFSSDVIKAFKELEDEPEAA